MNEIFKNLSSGTLSANGNQTYIADNIPEGTAEGLVFIKVFRGGTFNWHFIYSGVIDSTFSDGSVSVCNDICNWTIDGLQVAVTDRCEPGNPDFAKVYFDGKESIYIGNREFVESDAVKLTAEKNSYICLKIRFSGSKIPCHKESIIPIYRNSGKKWFLCPEVPVPVMSAIEYEPEKRIAFIGDSITQGIGSTFNSYKNYVAAASESIGERYAYWNLGLGFGRGSDAASDGIWLKKALENDIVSVCYGVNDIQREHTAQEIKDDIRFITEKLKNAGIKVLLQTIPPFDYDKEKTAIWIEVNEYIRNDLSAVADGIFDNVPVLSKGGKNNPSSEYGGHPNDKGCGKWAEALVPEILKII